MRISFQVLIGLVVTWCSVASRLDAFEFIPLGDLPGGEFASIAADVSSDGSTVVGRTSSSNGEQEAFVWTREGGMVGLGDLAGGEFNSGANAISLDGSTIVGFGTTDRGREAFRWTQAGEMTSLFAAEDQVSFVEAFDVSSDGSTVIGEADSDTEATRWTESTGARRLEFPFFGFWSRAHPLGISGDGSRAVGFTALDSGVDVVVPEKAYLPVKG